MSEKEKMYLPLEDASKLLNVYGHGDPTKVKILFFGIEEGLNGMDINAAIHTRLDLYSELPSDGVIKWYNTDVESKRRFSQIATLYGAEAKVDDVNLRSDFLTYTARLILSLKDPDTSWFSPTYEVGQVRSFMEKNMYSEYNGLSSALVDWRPLPKADEKDWPYSNICKRSYLRAMNMGTRILSDMRKGYNDMYTDWANARLNGMSHLLKTYTPELVVGIGDTVKKKHVLSLIHLRITGENMLWQTIVLPSGKKIEVATIKHSGKCTNIILTPFFSRRKNCLTMNGLADLSNYILSNKLVST